MKDAPITCRRRFCGARVVERMDPLGRIVYDCAPCIRNAKGLCRDCPAPLVYKGALRCRACSAKRTTAKNTEYARLRIHGDEQTHERDLKVRRERSHHPDAAAKRKAYQKQYRATHKRPRDDYDRIYWREYMRNWRAGLTKGRPSRSGQYSAAVAS